MSQHQTVNFMDPTTGVHTHNVESYWNRVKGKFKCMKGVHEVMLTSYIDEFISDLQFRDCTKSKRDKIGIKRHI